MAKIAIIHDWLTGMRGGEHVLEAVCKIYPGAEIFCLFHVPNSVSKEIESRRIHTSFLQGLPFIKRYYRYYLPLFPAAIERFNFKDYDLVISLSHCVAKGVITPVNSYHISYIFTPMRYAWDKSWEYFETEKIPGLNRWLLAIFLNYLRIWDVASMKRVDSVLTISNFVAKRLKKYTKINSDVVYPPVDTEFFTPGRSDDGYYLVVSALAPYKMIENAIRAIKKLGKKLVIVGSGQMEPELKKMSDRNIIFTGWVPREEVRRLMQGCTAFILPGEEDFGIAAVEAQACGKPVIALGRGASLETVCGLGTGDSHTAPTGVFFHESSPDSLAEAIIAFEKNSTEFDPGAIRRHSLRFSQERFIKEFTAYIERSTGNHDFNYKKIEERYA